MHPLRSVVGKHRPAFVLSLLLLGAALWPGGPLGLRASMASLYAPLALLAGPAAPAPADPDRLRQENDALRAEIVALKTEGAALREFRGVKWEARSRPTRVVEATVLGRDRSSPLRRSLLVNAGSADGVRRGQPVVVGQRLVGFVEEAGPACSLVRLLDDPGARAGDPGGRVGVKVLRPGASTSVEGILVGEGKGSLRLQMVPAGSVAVGDLVVTSAADAKVPAGLLVGKVLSVQDDRRTRLAEAVVAPGGDLSGLSSILVLVMPEVSLQASRGGKSR